MTEAPSAQAPSERTRVNRYRWIAKYDAETIHGILDAMPLCYIAYIHDNKPVVTPTLQWRDGDRVYWHGAAAGRMMKATASQEVCLCVSLFDGLIMARTSFNFNVNHRSVMVFGKAEPLTDPAEKERQLKRFVDGFVAGQWDRLRPPTEAELGATSLLSLSLAEASAKVRTGGPEDNEADYEFPAWAGTIPVSLQVGAPIPDPRNLPGVEMPPEVLKFKIG